MADGSCGSTPGGGEGAEMDEIPPAIAQAPGERARDDAVAACQAALRREAAVLKLVYLRIGNLVGELPRSDQEISWRDIGEAADRVTTVRALAMGVMTDLLEPAVKNLLAAASYAPGNQVPEARALDSELLALPPPGASGAEGWETGPPSGLGLGLPENLEVTVKRAGCLPLPVLVSRLLFLLPGDAVVLEPGPASLRLTPWRDWTQSLRALPAGQRARALAELSQGALTFVTPDWALPLPPEILPLSPGEVAVLQLQERGGSYRLYAFKDETAEAGAGAAGPEDLA